jgi:hypothetical protein
MFGGLTGGAKNVQRWLHLGGQDPAPAQAVATDPDQPSPAAGPLPPRRDDSVHMASLRAAPTPPARPNAAETPADAPDSTQ